MALYPLFFVVGFTTFWVFIYRYLCSFNDKSAEWNCRLLTTIHALALTTLSLFCAYCIGPWPFAYPGGDTTVLQEIILAFSLGYFIFDLSWCLSHKTEGTVMLAHHAASIISLFYCIIYQTSGTELIAALGGAEISNPLLQLRWFLRDNGYDKRGFAVNFVEYVFAAAFLFVRGIFGSYFLYCVVRHPAPSVVIKLGGITIYIISLLFSGMIIRFIWRKQVWLSTKAKENGEVLKETRQDDSNSLSNKSEIKFVDSSPARYNESKVR